MKCVFTSSVATVLHVKDHVVQVKYNVAYIISYNYIYLHRYIATYDYGRCKCVANA